MSVVCVRVQTAENVEEAFFRSANIINDNIQKGIFIPNEVRDRRVDMLRA